MLETLLLAAFRPSRGYSDQCCLAQTAVDPGKVRNATLSYDSGLVPHLYSWQTHSPGREVAGHRTGPQM